MDDAKWLALTIYITSDHLSVYCKLNGRYKVASTDYIDIISDPCRSIVSLMDDTMWLALTI